MNRTLLAALCLLGLGACDMAPNTPTAEAPAPSAPPPAEMLVIDDNSWPDSFVDTDDTLLTHEELLGMWSNAPGCARPIVYLSDGTFTNLEDVSGRWTLEGDRLTRIYPDRANTNLVDQFDANTFSERSPDNAPPSGMQLYVMNRRCA